MWLFVAIQYLLLFNMYLHIHVTELWVIPYTQKNWAALISAEGIECLKFDMNFSFCQFDMRPDFNSEMLVLLDFGGRFGAAISY